MSWDLGSTGSGGGERMRVSPLTAACTPHCFSSCLKMKWPPVQGKSSFSPLRRSLKKIFFNSLLEHTNFERTRKNFLIFILLLCYTCLKISSCSKYISLEYQFSHSYISLSTFLLIFLRYDLFNNLTNTCMFIMYPNTFIYSSYKLFLSLVLLSSLKAFWGHLTVFQSTASSPVCTTYWTYYAVCMTASVSNVVTGTFIKCRLIEV